MWSDIYDLMHSWTLMKTFTLNLSEHRSAHASSTWKCSLSCLNTNVKLRSTLKTTCFPACCLIFTFRGTIKQAFASVCQRQVSSKTHFALHPIISQREGFTLRVTLLFIAVWRFCVHSAIRAFNKRTGGTVLGRRFLLFYTKWQSPSPNSWGSAHSASRSLRRSLQWGWAAQKHFKTDSRVTAGKDSTQYGGKI